MTTERALPAVTRPVPQATDLAPRPRRAVGGPVAVGTHEPLLTTPVRVAMLLGASATAYAVSLAAVGGLQSSSDAAAAARTRPWLDQVAEARAANDRLEAALLQASGQAQALGDAYGRTGAAVAAYEARLDALAALVADVEGTAASLPSRISLPKVTVRGAVRTTRPATTSTSGASGG